MTLHAKTEIVFQHFTGVIFMTTVTMEVMKIIAVRPFYFNFMILTRFLLINLNAPIPKIYCFVYLNRMHTGE